MKLNLRFYEPYKIVQNIGEVAYKLWLLMRSAIHPVFHVSLLKKQISSDAVATYTILVTDEDGRIRIRLVAILDRKLMKKNNSVAMMGLDQLSNFFQEDATWEEFEELTKQFSDLDIDS